MEQEEMKEIVFDAVNTYFALNMKAIVFREDTVEDYIKEVEEGISGRKEIIKYLKENLK